MAADQGQVEIHVEGSAPAAAPVEASAPVVVASEAAAPVYTNGSTTAPVADSSAKSADAPVDQSAAKLAADNKSAGSAGKAADKANDAIANNAQAKKASAMLSPGFQEPFFGCFSSIPGCALACCCPCIVAAANEANVAERPITYVDCLCCPSPYTTKQTLRKKYNMGYNPYNDCFATACCGCCALHQTTREIAARTGRAPEYIKMV